MSHSIEKLNIAINSTVSNNTNNPPDIDNASSVNNSLISSIIYQQNEKPLTKRESDWLATETSSVSSSLSGLDWLTDEQKLKISQREALEKESDDNDTQTQSSMMNASSSIFKKVVSGLIPSKSPGAIQSSNSDEFLDSNQEVVSGDNEINKESNVNKSSANRYFFSIFFLLGKIFD